jgi:hypothetical protein
MELTKEQIEFLDRVVSGGRMNWTLNSDGKVDVDGWVFINNGDLTEIPIKFGKVSKSFYCSNNNLTSLEGAPSEVGGYFNCFNNLLTSLEFTPSYVGGWFDCHNNPLKDYFKNIKEEEFKHWGNLNWRWVIKEYPFLINICKKYITKNYFIELVEKYPKTKLYLR